MKGWAGDGAGEPRWSVGNGARTPLLGGQAMVQENSGGVGGRWCEKTISGPVADGARKPW